MRILVSEKKVRLVVSGGFNLDLADMSGDALIFDAGGFFDLLTDLINGELDEAGDGGLPRVFI